MPALDIYTPPKPKAAPTGIPGLDDEPIGDSPLLADMQAKKQAVAIQRQQAQQSAAQEQRQAAEYQREEEARRNPPQIPQGLEPSSAVVGPDGKVTRQYSAPQPTATTGEATAMDMVKAGLNPDMVPRSEWNASLAKAHGGREGKLTEMQSNALQYSARMAYNRDILDKLEQSGFDAASINTGMQNLAPNLLRSPAVQTYRAARDNWVSAVLRKESGAAISKSEYENAYRQYFPQVGDAPEIIRQKANLRKIAEDNMKLVAGGRAAEAETGVPPQTPPAQPAAPSADKFVVGQVYKDAQGNQATYLGNGKWQ